VIELKKNSEIDRNQVEGCTLALDVTWGNPEKTYTVFKFSGRWTWDEYHAAVKKGSTMIEDIPYNVNILLDLSECKLFPNNMLSHFGNSMQRPPREFDLAVIVTTSGFVQTFATIIDKVYGKKGTRFKVVKTVDEAHAMLASMNQHV
jgi:hypothetical protein